MNPNILLLHAHDAGKYSEVYGHPIPAPNLRKFAEDAVIFRNAFAVSPTCGPSRTALFTGCYPHQVGMFGLPGRQGWTIPDVSRHLVHVLNRAGYETALAGVQHEVDHRDMAPLGYQTYVDVHPQKGEFYPDTIDRVEEFLQKKRDRSFFLSVGVDEPHRDNFARPEIGVGPDGLSFSKTRYYDPGKIDARFAAPPPFLPDHPEIRREMAAFHEGVRIMDEYFGRVFDMLHHRGLFENTLVIVTADHGIEFPGAKMTLSDQGLGVMLLIRGPGAFSGGRVIDSLVSHLDIAPTILEICGLPPVPWHEGKCLAPLVSGQVASIRDAVHAEQTYHGSLEALRAIRTSRHKLVFRHDPVGPKMRCCGNSSSFMNSVGYYDRQLGAVQLFDLMIDPMEACNRADDSPYREVRDDLTRRLVEWMERTGDPFPAGNFPKPINW